MFGLGVAAGREGGTQPAVYNAANEIAVRAFLDHDLSFPGISKVVETVLMHMDSRPVHTLDDVQAADLEARARAREAAQSLA